MPDLNTETYWCCVSVRNWQAMIDGHRVAWEQMPPSANYGFGMVCDCKGFKFRRKCRHAEKAEGMRCGWQQFVHGGEPADGRCPKCRGEVTAERYAV